MSTDTSRQASKAICQTSRCSFGSTSTISAMSSVAQSLLHSVNIPLDVCFEVIDWLDYYGDHRDLMSCALTCSAWLPRARYHLYRSVMLYRGLEEYHLFARTILGSPPLGTLVQSLELSITFNNSIWDDTEATDAIFPVEAVHTLTGLRHLSIESYCFEATYPEVLAFLSRFALATSVTSLVLASFLSTPAKDIIKFIGLFPNVQELNVVDHFSDDEFDPTLIDHLAPDFCSKLTKLSLCDNTIDAHFLAVMPDHITSLSLERCNDESSPEDSRANIARFTKLKSLSLEAIHLDRTDWVAEALSYARCHELRTLIFQYHWCNCWEFCKVPMAQQLAEVARIADIVSREPAFRKLQTFSVSAGIDASIEKDAHVGMAELQRRFKKGLEDALQECRNRGIEVKIEAGITSRKKHVEGEGVAE